MAVGKEVRTPSRCLVFRFPTEPTSTEMRMTPKTVGRESFSPTETFLCGRGGDRHRAAQQTGKSGEYRGIRATFRVPADFGCGRGTAVQERFGGNSR